MYSFDNTYILGAGLQVRHRKRRYADKFCGIIITEGS
jgi:hypothetical protein